jgi:hypothetical protein
MIDDSILIKNKDKGAPYTGLDRLLGLQEVEINRFSKLSAHASGKLSTLRTGRLYHTRIYPWYSFLLEGHNVGGRIKPMKCPNGTIGNWTRDLPACGAVIPYWTFTNHKLYNNAEYILKYRYSLKMAMDNSRNMWECFIIQELVQFVAHELVSIITYVRSSTSVVPWVTWPTCVCHHVRCPLLDRFMND